MPGSGETPITGIELLNGYTSFNIPALDPYALLAIYSSNQGSSAAAAPEPGTLVLLMLLVTASANYSPRRGTQSANEPMLSLRSLRTWQ